MHNSTVSISRSLEKRIFISYDGRMNESFNSILAVGGKSNSLGRTDEVIYIVLQDQSCMEELYMCVFDEDAWVRMRAVDAIEKICRQNKVWLLPYIDRFISDFHTSTQASIQWHLAQIYKQVELTDPQRKIIIRWLSQLISTSSVDWIVAANAMDTLAQFARAGYLPKRKFIKLVYMQQQHASNAVKKRANIYLTEFLAK